MEAVDLFDEFIESGVNLCFGVLLLFISMVPPAWTRMLSILGFRGGMEHFTPFIINTDT